MDSHSNLSGTLDALFFSAALDEGLKEHLRITLGTLPLSRAMCL